MRAGFLTKVTLLPQVPLVSGVRPSPWSGHQQQTWDESQKSVPSSIFYFKVRDLGADVGELEFNCLTILPLNGNPIEVRQTKSEGKLESLADSAMG